MTGEELELLTDIRDFTSLFYVIFRRESSEWSESSIESDLGMGIAIWSLNLTFPDFAFFEYSFWCEDREEQLVKKSIFLVY